MQPSRRTNGRFLLVAIGVATAVGALGVWLADRYAGQGNARLLVAAAMGLGVGLVGASVGMLLRRK